MVKYEIYSHIRRGVQNVPTGRVFVGIVLHPPFINSVTNMVDGSVSSVIDTIFSDYNFDKMLVIHLKSC